MANTSLTPDLVAAVTELASVFAQSQKVVSAKARIGLFYQSPEATDVFRKVSEYGEELRNKHMAGMTPSEEEIAKFDKMRQDVVENPLCAGFLEARQQLEELLSTVNQYLCLAIDKGAAPTDEEVAAAMTQQVSCSCGGGCHGHGDCGSCDNENCKHHGDSDHHCECGGEHECKCGEHCECGGEHCECGGEHCECGGEHCECGGEHECKCGGHHDGDHECCCGKH